MILAEPAQWHCAFGSVFLYSWSISQAEPIQCVEHHQLATGSCILAANSQTALALLVCVQHAVLTGYPYVPASQSELTSERF